MGEIGSFSAGSRSAQDVAPRFPGNTGRPETVYSLKGHLSNLKEAAMKRLLFASMIAIASAFAIAPASAGSVQFGIGVGPSYDPYYGDDYYGGYYPHRYYRHVYDDDYYTPYRERYVVRYHNRYYSDNCRIKIVKHWRHHHRVIERIRICER
ncbi:MULTISPECIES: hypothetical protein [Mesorhizobium]|uniref:Lectin-like protein BA14k n=1 Tax=Mesorhizobium shonense TaxID=1209948 RepID=A0ABV2HJD4_9HYPH|nr:hypothetical protein [Mesorhizobium sp.]